MIKKFAVFYWHAYEAAGGMNDCHSSHDNITDALEAAQTILGDGETDMDVEVWDMEMVRRVVSASQRDVELLAGAPQPAPLPSAQVFIDKMKALDHAPCD